MFTDRVSRRTTLELRRGRSASAEHDAAPKEASWLDAEIQFIPQCADE
jgi:hypothetical protein